MQGALVELERGDLVRAQTDVDPAYFFKHALVQDAAYGTLLLHDRRALHLDVAHALERVLGDGSRDELAAVLTQHYAQGGDADKTLEYATLAGDAAARVYANAEAIMFYSQALDLAKRRANNTAPLIELYTHRGRAWELAGMNNKALASYEEMETLARARADRALELAALMAQATIRITPSAMHDPAQGSVLVERALALARELGDRRAEAKILWQRMLLGMYSGHPREAVPYGEQSLAAASELNLREQMAYTTTDLAEAVMFDDHTRAVALREQAIQLWREMDNLPMLANVISSKAVSNFFVGEWDQSLASSQEAYAICQSIGNAWGQSYSLIYAANIYLERGETGYAIRAAQECIELAEQSGFVVPQVATRGTLGFAYAAMGMVKHGLELASQGLGMVEQAPFVKPELYAILAYLYVLDGNPEAAGRAMQETGGAELSGSPLEELTRQQGAMQLALARHDYRRVLEITDWFLSAELWQDNNPMLYEPLLMRGKAMLGLGDLPEAHRLLQAARTSATKLNARRLQWQIDVSLADLARQQGHLAVADDLKAEARSLIEYIADHAGSDDLRHSFLNLPQVREVMA